jgi:hypothetical protein
MVGRYAFLVDTYATEILKVLSVWSMATDADLDLRPRLGDRRGRTLREHMIHQCQSEHGWFTSMFGIPTVGEVLPASPTRLGFLHHYVAAGSSLPSDGIEPPVPAQQMEVEPGPWSTFAEVGLTAGRYAIVARVAGYAVATQVVELGDDELRAGIRVLLQRPAVVRGKLVDAAGQPVSGHAFLVGVGPLADQHLAAWEPWRRSEHPAGAREPSFTPHQARVAADGSFVLDDVPPGVELRLVLRHDAHGQVVLPLGVLRAGETIANLQARLPGR